MEFPEGGLLRTLCIKNNHKYNQEYGKLKKRIPSRVCFKDFVHR